MTKEKSQNIDDNDIRPTIRFVLYALFFASGISGLVYEIIWMRKLSLIFGNTVYGTSTVLTTFMGGLALGSYWLGRIADRRRDLVRMYAVIELGIGLSVLMLMFFFLRIMDGVYIWSYQNLSSGPLVLNTVRFLMAIFILIIPTTLMGGTLPVMSKMLVRQNLRLGFEVGNLYALNTLGAMIGAFATGFFLIKNLGETTATLIAIAINFAVAIIILLLLKRSVSIQPQNEMTTSKARIEKARCMNAGVDVEVTENIRSASRRGMFVLIIFGFAGFASLAYEVVWTRALLFFVSSRVYSFSIILTTFLAGIMLGSFIFAQIVDKFKRPFLNLGIIEIIIGLVALITIPTIQHLQNFNVWLGQQMGITSWTGTVFILFATCAVVLVLPTFLMGAAFPIVNRIYSSDLPNIGKRVGNVYSINTLGAIIGSFLTGFFILPAFGIITSILVFASINVVIGIWATFLENHKRKIYTTSLLVSVSAIVLLVFGGWTFYTNNPIITNHPVFKGNRIQYYKDTPSGSLSALESIEEIGLWGRNVKFLNINGNNTAHTTFADIIVHKMLAHVPMLLHPDPKEALVIGFGFGSTSRSILYYDVDRVDCVELIAQERETAKYFLPENKNVLDHPKFNLIVNDGRNFLLVTEKKYDVISFNAIDPKMSPTLYTRDFYELCKNRLETNGLIAAWLPFYGLEPRENLSLLRSFLDVFPNSTLWYCNPEHFVLLGSVEPYSLDINELKNRFNQFSIQQDLHEIHLNDLRSFLATCIMGEKGLAQMVKDVPLNTDLRPVVEFSRVSVARTFSQLYEELMGALEPFPFGLPEGTVGQGDSLSFDEIERFADNQAKMLRELARYENSIWNGDSKLRQDAYENMIQTVKENLQNHFNLLFFVDWVQHQNLIGSLDIFKRAIEIEPQFAKAYVFIGMAYLQNGDFDGAESMFRNAIKINERYVSANFNLGLTFEMQQKWQTAIKAYKKVLSIDDNFFAHSKLSNAYAYSGDLERAIFHCERALDIDPKNAPSYFNLGLFLEKQGKIKKAIRAFKNGLKINPEDQKAKTHFQRLLTLLKS